MAEQLDVSAGFKPVSRHRRVRDLLAKSLGVKPEKKEEIYLQVSQSATLMDVSYWSQVLFSAGIATLGLTLNSPAVIIGAMLISPLMGPILASGLALASGDLVLATRAAVNLFLSCLVAILFAVVLVALLPFKEITAEIAARTQPNTLDLVIALFSGAVGSIAICKEVKGVTTSIPGVAIAVALMPPLCVMGYGFGLAVSLNVEDGARIARGGGLLFLTNLVAIIFTAMVVFVALNIDTERVKERIREWQSEDRESLWVQQLFGRIPVIERFRFTGSLSGRFLAVGLVILLILVPLTQSFMHLKREIGRQQQENRIRRAATQLWEENFSRLPNGEIRGYLGQLSLVDREDRLALLLRVFTIKPYTSQEKAEYTRLVAARVDRPVQSVAVRLIEIPTVSSELLEKSREATRESGMDKGEDRAEEVFSLGRLHTNYAQLVETALGDLVLPPPATFVDYQVTTTATAAAQINLVYLSEREIEPDAKLLLTEEIRRRFEKPDAPVKFERIESLPATVSFGRNQTEIDIGHKKELDRIGQQLQRFGSLKAELAADAEITEDAGVAQERSDAIVSYLAENWTIDRTRIDFKPTNLQGREAVLMLKGVARK